MRFHYLPISLLVSFVLMGVSLGEDNSSNNPIRIDLAGYTISFNLPPSEYDYEIDPTNAHWKEKSVDYYGMPASEYVPAYEFYSRGVEDKNPYSPEQRTVKIFVKIYDEPMDTSMEVLEKKLTPLKKGSCTFSTYNTSDRTYLRVSKN